MFLNHCSYFRPLLKRSLERNDTAFGKSTFQTPLNQLSSCLPTSGTVKPLAAVPGVEHFHPIPVLIYNRVGITTIQINIRTHFMTASIRLFLLSALIFILAACGSSAPTETEPTAQEINPDDVIATVVSVVDDQIDQWQDERIDGETDGQTSSDTVDIDEIIRAVVATLEPRLIQQNPTVQISNQADALANEEDLQETLIDLYRRSNPSVVYILTNVGSGSGFVYSDEGYVVTNNHVIEDSPAYEIVFANGERRRGDLIGRDVDSDLAVLDVEDLPTGVEPLPLAGADDIQVGQFVVAIGNPFGEQGSMSLGIVSGLDRSIRSRRTTSAGGGYTLPEVIQTDAPINPGNSGGPLFNLDGEVVGVNSAIASTTGANTGVGFAIPVAAVRQIIPHLIADGGYEYPYLGVSFVDQLSLADQQALDLPSTLGVYVLTTTQDGPADKAGMRGASTNSRGGDLIVRLDDVEVKDFSDLNSYLVFNTMVGQTIKVTVLRGDQEIVLDVMLGARP